MSLSTFELHPDRLATTDETGRRVFIDTADVRGSFRRHQKRLRALLILFFLLLPWTTLRGHQSLLLDIANRHFEIFGLSLRAHNAPLLVLVLAAAAFTLFFTTAVWGRSWCGWACPQTVFVDGVFRRIERWVEGPALERRRQRAAPWGYEKIIKFSAKWLLFTFAALVITHSFLAYFVGAQPLLSMLTSSPREHWLSFLFIVVSTAIVLADFAWFREQFCVIVCPYGRFQSVLMDDHSTVVAYDAKRGEPRATPQAKALIKSHGGKLGDCVNCYRCVQVCPVGIDIRRGTQMECVACTACIDACDEVMAKTHKPKGLIRYATQASLAGKETSIVKRMLRARPLIYATIAIASMTALFAILHAIEALDVSIVRAGGPPYFLQGGDVTNHFVIEITNQSDEQHSITLSPAPNELSTKETDFEIISPREKIKLDANKVTRVDVYLRSRQSKFLMGRQHAALLIRDHLIGDSSESNEATMNQDKTIVREVPLVGPFL